VHCHVGHDIGMRGMVQPMLQRAPLALTLKSYMCRHGMDPLPSLGFRPTRALVRQMTVGLLQGNP
jgi:hypothetical protein